MKKISVRALAVLLAVVLCVPMLPAAMADGDTDRVSASIPLFQVTLNGRTYESFYSRYPLIVCNDITYFPMTYHAARWLGLTTAWSEEEGLGVYAEPVADAVFSDYQAPMDRENWFAEQTPAVADFPVQVNGKPVDNASEPYPLLVFRDVTYFPLTWRFCVDEFHWSYEFSWETGLVINSDGAPAAGPADPETRRSLAYADTVRAYEEQLGENPDADPDKTGVFYLDLVDFDQDGGDELVVGYYYKDPDPTRGIHWDLAVWSYTKHLWKDNVDRLLWHDDTAAICYYYYPEAVILAANYPPTGFHMAGRYAIPISQIEPYAYYDELRQRAELQYIYGAYPDQAPTILRDGRAYVDFGLGEPDAIVEYTVIGVSDSDREILAQKRHETRGKLGLE